MHLIQIERQGFLPVTVEDLKKHSVIDHTDDDALLEDLLHTAVEQVEVDTGRTLVDTTRDAVLQCFPKVIRLPRPPVAEVLSIQYVDADGVEQALQADDYRVSLTVSGAEVRPVPGGSWPGVQANNAGAVRARYRAGYMLVGEGETVVGELPRRARQAVLIWAAHLYENREHMSPVQLYELPSYRSLLATLETGLV